ncbi:chaperonin GroES [Pseudogymnoascus sp. 03VT05]|nr:chaperonin GroES [Pseudogymnoascus sp. 03VT05]
MYLFTVILPLAIQASLAHAVPPGLPSKYAYQRGVDHDASLTASTVGMTPAVGIHGRDMASDVAGTTSTALKSIKSLAPLLDRVLVQRIKAQTQTAGGIFLPESSVKELNEARVLAVGPGGLDKEGKNVKPSVKAGDKVLIPQYGGSPVKVGEEEYALFRDYELLAKINE